MINTPNALDVQPPTPESNAAVQEAPPAKSPASATPSLIILIGADNSVEIITDHPVRVLLHLDEPTGRPGEHMLVVGNQQPNIFPSQLNAAIDAALASNAKGDTNEDTIAETVDAIDRILNATAH